VVVWRAEQQRRGVILRTAGSLLTGMVFGVLQRCSMHSYQRHTTKITTATVILVSCRSSNMFVP
jgi:hypothetical protein